LDLRLQSTNQVTELIQVLERHGLLVESNKNRQQSREYTYGIHMNVMALKVSYFCMNSAEVNVDILIGNKVLDFPLDFDVNALKVMPCGYQSNAQLISAAKIEQVVKYI
jgi:hypothetical protein